MRHPRDVVKDPEAIQRELAFELAAIVAVPLGHWKLAQQYPYPLFDPKEPAE